MRRRSSASQARVTHLAEARPVERGRQPEANVGQSDPPRKRTRRVHPAWIAFVKYCEALQHGEIHVLKIQDGIPVLAEMTKKKTKFT